MIKRGLHLCPLCGVRKRMDQYRFVGGAREKHCARCANRLDFDARKRAKAAKRAEEIARRMEPLPGEEWRPVAGWEGRYEISNFGRFKRLIGQATRLPGIAILNRRSWGYPSVELRDEQGFIRRHVSIHSLVAEAFIGPRPDGYQVNHINGNKNNPRVENLEYVTSAENNRHALKTGLTKVDCENNPATRLTNNDVHQLRARFSAGESRRVLANDYGLSLTGLCDILKGKVFKGLNLKPLTRPTLSEAIVAVIRKQGRPVRVIELPTLLRGVHFNRRAGRQTHYRGTCYRLSQAGLLHRTRKGFYEA